MPKRLAVVVSLVVFAVCIACGLMAENTFAETIRRALIAMFVTLVVGLIVGFMAQKMLEENAKQVVENEEISETESPAKGR